MDRHCLIGVDWEEFAVQCNEGRWSGTRGGSALAPASVAACIRVVLVVEAGQVAVL